MLGNHILLQRTKSFKRNTGKRLLTQLIEKILFKQAKPIVKDIEKK